MKKLTTLLVAVFVSFQISAQTDQGTVLLGGNTGFSFSSMTLNSDEPYDMGDSKISQTEMELSLDGGYFLIDGLAAGLSVSYGSETTKWSSGDDESTNTEATMMIAPFVRYYIMETGLWAQASYGFGSVTDKDVTKAGGSTDTDEDKDKTTEIGIGIGYKIGLNDHVSLNPMIGYNMTTYTYGDKVDHPDTGEEVNHVRKAGGIGFGLGLNVHLF